MVELFTEAYRLRLLRGFEQLLSAYGYTSVAGVDEAGRGCLAGPVVAAAVIPDPACVIPGVDDSKRLSAAQREGLATVVRQTSYAWAVAAVSAGDIDRINILEATRLAMRRALAALAVSPDLVVTDAVTLSGIPARVIPVVRGDSVCYAVACASILAKVARDRMMVELDGSHPQYGFAAHKGYAAASHRRALRRFGPSPAHRLTFRSVLPREDDAVRPVAGAAS